MCEYFIHYIIRRHSYRDHRERVSSIDPGDSQINQREQLLNRDDEFERGNGKRRKQKSGGGGYLF